MKESSRKQIEATVQSKDFPTKSDSDASSSKDIKKKAVVDDFYDDVKKPSKIVSEVPKKEDIQGRVGGRFHELK